MSEEMTPGAWPSLEDVQAEILKQFAFLMEDYQLPAPRIKTAVPRELAVEYQKGPLVMEIMYEIHAGIWVTVKFSGPPGSRGALDIGWRNVFERLGRNPRNPSLSMTAHLARWKDIVRLQADAVRELFIRDRV